MKKGCRFSVCGRLAALAVAVLPALAFADDTPTQPASPISRPASGTITIRRTGKILILPFAAINPTDPQPWIGKSVQQSLVADLLVIAPNRVVTLDQVVGTVEDAAALARRVGAAYVVTGSFITSNNVIRVTGQVIDAHEGQALAGLMVTGIPDELFHMEDGLAMQVKGTLMPDVMVAEQQRLAQQGAATQPPSQPAAENNPPAGASWPGDTFRGNNANPPVDNFTADYDRYYFSYPSNVYTYNTYNYSGSGFDYGWSYPYYYASPLLGFSFIGGVGHSHYYHDYGHSNGAWHADHGAHPSHPIARPPMHRIGSAANLTEPAIGITNSTQIDYAGIVSGNLTNAQFNKAIVPTQKLYPGPNSAAIPVPLHNNPVANNNNVDPPGTIRAHSMVLHQGPDTPTGGPSRTHVSSTSFRAVEGPGNGSGRGVGNGIQTSGDGLAVYTSDGTASGPTVIRSMQGPQTGAMSPGPSAGGAPQAGAVSHSAPPPGPAPMPAPGPIMVPSAPAGGGGGGYAGGGNGGGNAGGGNARASSGGGGNAGGGVVVQQRSAGAQGGARSGGARGH
ncbi:MAG TPA: hypothetical protein VH370_02045 [Humisphaera sp.]|jgi:TolB-like protein|nr:hypothetical protein [Humisphaera sp.]